MIMTRSERISLATLSVTMTTVLLIAVAYFSKGSPLAWFFIVSFALFLVTIIAMIRTIRLRSSIAR